MSGWRLGTGRHLISSARPRLMFSPRAPSIEASTSSPHIIPIPHVMVPWNAAKAKVSRRMLGIQLIKLTRTGSTSVSSFKVQLHTYSYSRLPRLGVQRLRTLQEKKNAQAKASRRDIALLLEKGRLETARIKTENSACAHSHRSLNAFEPYQ